MATIRTEPIRLGVNIAINGIDAGTVVGLATRAEALGFDSLWTGEAYGSDAVVPLAWAAAHTERISLGTGIMQIDARTAAMTAMTAMTLDRMSGGRLRLGLGVSGPQVVEGWHGRPFAKPIERTAEVVAAVRTIMSGGRLELDGRHLQVPFRGKDSTGLGKPLKSTLVPGPPTPIYLAAMGPRNVRAAVRMADGMLPLFWSPERWRDAYGASLDGADLDAFDVSPSAWVVVGDDIDECRDRLRPFVAMYVGGMGAVGRNFYNDVVRRFGFDHAARTVQQRFLAGDRKGAMAAIPAALIDEIALVGPPARIRERLAAWGESPARTVIVSVDDIGALDVVAEANR